MDIGQMVSQMTLEEKASMCSGADHWRTKAVDRLNIPAIMLADGPYGLRKQPEGGDHLGLQTSKPATCYPTPAAIASSWDRSLAEQVGSALGAECQSENIAILLSPGVNMKRSPLCGRNFEYFSEDPCITGEMASSYVTGLQNQGVGASLKHFAANNQEHKRFLVDSIIDERTLRELYLAGFEQVVKEARPWSVMCAYNKLNGLYCSEHPVLLTDILKREWGHEGFVVSDWGAVNERVKGLAAGLELEMPPGSFQGDQAIVKAVKDGSLPESILDESVRRLLTVVFKSVANKRNLLIDAKVQHASARKAAQECMVLLKNQDQILPLKKEGCLAVIGAFAQKPRFQGGGSSHVVPTMVDNSFDELVRLAGPDMNVLYAEGYRLDPSESRYVKEPFKSVSDHPDFDLIEEAREAAAKAQTAVIFAGLPDSYETEGTDRTHLRIPEGQRMLIEAVAEVQTNVVVVLFNGAPVEMPWLDRVKGVLEGYLAGQAAGSAAADILFGEVNPSGKLAESFPVKLSDTPTYYNVPGDEDRVLYSEGLFIGYRYFEAKEIEPLFPFGFGLSYTTYEYTEMKVDKKRLSDEETVTVSLKVKNSGNRAGKEIVQLYVSDKESRVVRPRKELKGFEKVDLLPGEEKTVIFQLGKRAFAYYNTDIGDWYVESGEFEIMAGKSSREIELSETVEIISSTAIKRTITRNSTFYECLADPAHAALVKPMMQGIAVKLGLVEGTARERDFFRHCPLRSTISLSPTPFTEQDLEEVLHKLNES